jgi:hypothetical protein
VAEDYVQPHNYANSRLNKEMNMINTIQSNFAHAARALHAVDENLSRAIGSDLPQVLMGFGLACGLIATLALFLSVKCEIRIHASSSRTRIESLAQKLDQARAPEPDALPATIESGPGNSQMNVGRVYASPINRSGMNAGKRVQAMRMVRRNQDIEHIAAALGTSRREVELLIRVQRMGAPQIRTAVN